MKYLVGAWLISLLLLSCAAEVQNAAPASAPADAPADAPAAAPKDATKLAFEKKIGELGCAHGCVRRPKGIGDLVGCVGAARLPANAILRVVYCKKFPSKETCTAATNSMKCAWIDAPTGFGTRLGNSYCVPAELIADEKLMLEGLEALKEHVQDAKIPEYTDIIDCLEWSSEDPEAAGKCAEKLAEKKCAVCDDIPASKFPMATPLTKLCLQADIAVEACAALRMADNIYCPVKPINWTDIGIDILGKAGCTVGCSKKPKSLAQLGGCAIGARLSAEGTAPLIYCAKLTALTTCEAKGNNPQCVWVTFPNTLGLKLGKTACLPAKLVGNKDVFREVLLDFEELPPYLPSFNDLMRCVTHSADTPAGSCVGATDSTKQACVLCTGIPAEATSPMKTPVTQLCLHHAIEAVVCASLKETPKNADCVRNTGSSPPSGVALISCMTSLCILLMSQI